MRLLGALSPLEKRAVLGRVLCVPVKLSSCQAVKLSSCQAVKPLADPSGRNPVDWPFLRTSERAIYVVFCVVELGGIEPPSIRQ